MKDTGRKGKPKFKTGQWVWCCICGIPVKILRMRGKCLASCSPRDGVDPETELRPLRRGERKP